MDKITFFVWADTHFGYQQRFAVNDFRWRIIEQMNRLPGWPYPPEIGGFVDDPTFVMHCGDVVDGGDRPANELRYCDHFCRHLKWPQYETLGNHDIDPGYLAEFTARHGGRSYSFDLGSWHFLSVDSDYDVHETGKLTPAQMQFVRDDLDQVPASTRTILFTHASLNRLQNADEMRDLLRSRNVTLAVAGHHHRPAVYWFGDTICVDVGHCRDHPIDAEYGRSFTVFRLRANQITAIPWRWDLQDWERGQRWGNEHAEQVDDVMNRVMLLEEL